MIELPLILISGLLGSSHCIGMCGPFALVIGAASRNWKHNVWRQFCYGCGRIFTYGFLGACAGFSGLWLSQKVPTAGAGTWVRVSSIMSVLAGVILIYQGLCTAGILPVAPVSATSPCVTTRLFASYLRGRGAPSAFLAGLCTGLLPCGLLYGFLTLAASSGSFLRGALVMLCFGAGTLPAMMFTGWGGSLLSPRARSRFLRGAAGAVVLAGVICVARGVGYLPLLDTSPAMRCPMCEP